LINARALFFPFKQTKEERELKAHDVSAVPELSALRACLTSEKNLPWDKENLMSLYYAL
jgi:hypothetical protein